MPGFSIILPSIIALFWILTHKRLPKVSIRLNYIPHLIPTFAVLFFLSLFLAFRTETRPLIYFIIISLSYIVILLQIVHCNDQINSTYILIQIILTNFSLILTTVFKYPLYFVGGDTLSHIRYSYITLSTGHSIPFSLEPAYSNYPGCHILAAIISEISSISIDKSLYIIITIVISALIIFLYYLFLSMSKIKNFSLIGIFFVIISPPFVYYSSYVVARNYAFLFFVIFLYSKLKSHNASVPLSIISMISAISLISVHSVTIIQMFFILAIFGIIGIIFHQPTPINLRSIYLLSVLYLSYSLYIANLFTNSILDYFMLQFHQFSAEYESRELIIPATIDINHFYWDHLNMMIYLFFLIIGVYHLIKSNNYFKIISIASLIFLILYIPNPIKQNEFILSKFGFYRLDFFIIPVIGLMVAVGFILFLNSMMQNKECFYARNMIIYALCFIAVFTSVTSIQNATDLNKETSTRFFGISDLKSIEFIEAYVPNNGSIRSDYFINAMFYPYRFFEGINRSRLKYFNSNIIVDINSSKYIHGYTLFRSGELKERGLLSFGSPSYPYLFIYNKKNLDLCKDIFFNITKIYGCGRNELFYN